jgi:hypothetical protein
MNVHLHIEQLVLEGLPVGAGDGGAIGAAVETELTRLLAAGVLGLDLRSGGSRPSVSAESIHLSGNDTPGSVGRQIGRAIFGGINR